jgi:hypothetical protein
MGETKARKLFARGGELITRMMKCTTVVLVLSFFINPMGVSGTSAGS